MKIDYFLYTYLKDVNRSIQDTNVVAFLKSRCQSSHPKQRI